MQSAYVRKGNALVQPEEVTMKRTIVWLIAGGAVLAIAADLMFATARQSQGPIFIAGDKPVTEEQIRQKLESDGWGNVLIVRQGRYFEAMAVKDGRTSKIAVDARSGRLRPIDDDDDDDD
jgi:hypothetical protein